MQDNNFSHHHFTVTKLEPEMQLGGGDNYPDRPNKTTTQYSDMLRCFLKRQEPERGSKIKPRTSYPAGRKALASAASNRQGDLPHPLPVFYYTLK